ncbi:semaphorin-4D-like isoform X1 [Podarcis raffonei]|uniref:semaphorin-4D-like isoform X1 n=1 Tax=Podarcis raffonei TaxID=65483 RepID=UPI0023296CB3|nr:semaphorin-4D-like isoform X1 [Podarcis raffonei]XP_053228510.1 semaphorin-4D-like isoform X1 [Podarcis raffonei]
MSGVITAFFHLLALWGTIRSLNNTQGLLDCVPRKTVVYHSENFNVFWKQGLSHFSTLFLSEETNILYVGAKGYILALDLSDISKEITREAWFAPENRKLECLRRGKSKADCQNYILILHKINATSLYVCGTNAFNPACRYMVMDNRKLKLLSKVVESRGRCPFEPRTRYTSLVVDGALYSATSNNFLGSEPIILRSLRNPLRTEFKASWLNEPTFVHMDLVQENGAGSDSDRVYVFFTEAAVEFDFYDKLLVSRVAQICTADLGGRRTLKKKWTSFLKATLVCSAPESDFQFNVLHAIFMIKTTNWRESIFYGIFTQQWGRLDISAICAFRMEAVQDLFQKGNFKGPLAVENSHAKWVVHRGEVPTPRPGACLNISARHQEGYSSSLDLPDRVLQFARDHPLMDGTVNPIGHQPVLVKRGVRYTHLVVDQTSGMDNATYDILFLGTDKGYLHKAVNLQGEIFIVEELQLFPSPEPVQTLKLAAQKGLLYAGSASRLVQLPVATCSRYKFCLDCVLARDPYCAWSRPLGACIPMANRSGGLRDLIQSVRNGDASRCPEVAKNVRRLPVPLGSSPHLSCSSLSSLATSVWTFNGSSLQDEEPKYLFHARGLVVFNMTASDTGLYECQSVETSNGREFRISMSTYFLYLQQESSFAVAPEGEPSNRKCAVSAAPKLQPLASLQTEDPARLEQPQRVQGLSFTLVLWGAAFALLFLSLLSWNLYQGHLSLPWKSVWSRRSETVDAVGAASPEPEQTVLIQGSLASCPISGSASESALLASSAQEACSTKAKQTTSLAAGRSACCSSNCLVSKVQLTDEEGLAA